MVSNASDDLPEPDSPVITTSLSRGISTSMFLRLCSRAPLMTIFFIAMGGRRASTFRARVALQPQRVGRTDFQHDYPITSRATLFGVLRRERRARALAASAAWRQQPDAGQAVNGMVLSTRPPTAIGLTWSVPDAIRRPPVS